MTSPKGLFARCLSILCGTALLSTSALAADDPSCKAVRMGVVNWTDVIATSGMADVLLNGLGYESRQTSAVQQIIFAGIRDKRLDIFLGYWKPAMDKNIAPFVAANQVKVMDKPSLADAQATLAVPDYVAAAGLITFADIARFKDQLGGKIYGIEPGSGANTTIKTMIETNHFGLKDFKLIESGEAGMLAAVQRANSLFIRMISCGRIIVGPVSLCTVARTIRSRRAVKATCGDRVLHGGDCSDALSR